MMGSEKSMVFLDECKALKMVFFKNVKDRDDEKY